MADQKHKNDENSPVVPTLMRDGSVGNGGNHCQKDSSCPWLQGWGLLGKACKKCVSDQKHKNNKNSPMVPTLIKDGSVGTVSNCCQIDIDCQRL